MANLTGSSLTENSSTFTNGTTEDKTENVLLIVSYIITIIINSITCPFTVLLNVLVIMAVKRRPRLQTNANILLACLAVTDVLTGLTSQPSFIAYKLSDLFGPFIRSGQFRGFGNYSFLRILSSCSCLHLVLVTCERLIAIKYTMHYEEIVTKRKIKVAVISCWTFTIFSETVKRIRLSKTWDLLVSLILISSIAFIALSYVVLYLETRRHQKMIKTQQMPQEEMERFAKENKALKTTVYVVGALVLCFSPMGFTLLFYMLKIPTFIPPPWVRTLAMLNSLLNPLIYCWRQKEMRKFVFRKQTQVVHPAH